MNEFEIISIICIIGALCNKKETTALYFIASGLFAIAGVLAM